MLIIIQHMKESAQGFSYNPLSPFCTPFTIISQVKESFISQPVSFPCLYEVYCPYSCKKIKIGLTKDKKVESLEFNTTTNRTVTFYANDSIRYLVNKHRPNKKDKKTVQGQGWSYCIQVQDKGNIAIFNPYCVDPLNPLSFYTFNKICSTDLPKENLKFQLKESKEAVIQYLGGKQVYFSPDLKWVGLNKYFEENSSQFVTIQNPNNKNEQVTMKTKELVCLANSYLNHYYGQLQKLIELQTKGIQFNENFSITENIDQIYEKIQFYLTILQQVRARLMNDSCSEAYKLFFPEHPRLYSSLQRLGSFLNYGNSKFNIVKLAQLGFFNKSDMLQDVSYVEFPQNQIPTLEEEDASTEQFLRKKLFPFARMTKQLPFPNVKLQSSLEAMHCQKTTNTQVLIRKSLDPYFLLVDKQSNVSIWSAQMMVYKMIEFDLSKNYQNCQNLLIPTSQNEKNAILPVLLPASDSPKVSQKQCVATQTQKNEQQVKPDENLLQQLKAMGYKENVAKKALIKTKNAEVETVIDAIQQLLKQKSTKKRTSHWKCNICTYINQPNFDKCQMCQQLAPEYDEEELIAQKKLQQERLLEQKKKAEEQKLKIQKQKAEKQRLIEEQKNQMKKELQNQQNKLKVSQIKSIAIYRTTKSNIDPFFVAILLQKPNQNFVLRTFRVGLNRKSLLNFYRIEDDYIVSNFTREVIKSKDFKSINNLIGNSRTSIEWGIKLFQPSSESIWTVTGQQNIELDGTYTEVKCYDEKIKLFDNQICVKSYEIQITDDLNKQKFNLAISQDKQPFNILEDKRFGSKTLQLVNTKQIKLSNQIQIDQNIQQICLQINEHVPVGNWKALSKEKDIKISSTIYSQNLIMSEFLPLKIQSHQGSIFSHKYSTTSMLQKSSDKNNVYISNYPDVSFSFKSIDNKPILVQSVAIISKNVKMNKIFPISAGLIFTANELSWFAIAKKRFSNFTKQEYDQWLKTKQMTGTTAAFWQPVAYFQINKNAEAQFEINFKRIAKYVFLLPTSVNKQDNKDDVIAVRIDFFGVKGRVEEQLPDAELNEGYRSQGQTSCQLSISQEDNQNWTQMKTDKFIIKSISSAGSFFFGPRYFNQFASKIPLSVTTIFNIKFKDLNHRKQLHLKSNSLKSAKIIGKKYSKNNIQQLNISSFSQLILKQNKLSDLQLQKVVNGLKLEDLFINLLKGPAQITHFENLLTKILNIHNFDQKVVSAMSQILLRICDPSIVVTDAGFKSFMRFYEKVISLDQQLVKKTIQKAWLETTQFYHKCKNKNYNILRNNYKIEQLVLEPALFNKDYYRLINPNYVEEEKTLSITAEPQTPINNRVYIDALSNFNYVYYIDALGHTNLSSIDLYFPKLSADNRYKIILKLVEIRVEKNEVKEKQIYYRYFHEDYLLQLSNKAFKETEIFKKTHINYCSIPGSLATPGTRFFKLYFDLMVVTTITNPRFKQLAQPYIILPVISSNGHQELKHQEHPAPQALAHIFKEFPQSTKHNSSLQRMPPHRFANQNRKLLYIVHQFKSKINEQVKSQSINKIQKIVQNILDKNIVTETASSIKINDYALNYKGLDFAYILMITLMKMFRKLPSSYLIDVKTMFILFDAYIVYEWGPIKNQTSSFLTQLYKRLSIADKNVFVQTIINNYLLDSEKIKNLKISQKYPVQKIIKFLGQFTLPIATLFEKLKNTKSLSAAAILIILISNNNSASSDQQPLDIYEANEVVRTLKVHQLIDISFKVSIWILNNASALSSQILELSLNLLLSFLTDKFSSVKVSSEQIKKFVENLSQEDFWQLIFGTIRKKNDLLNEKIYTIFKTLVENITENFQRGINNMLLEIIKNNQNSLYQKINPNVTDDARMNHLQTILEYLSLTNNKIFLDEDTAISLLSLPLTTTLWSLALKIIPRKDKILIQIIKKFSQEHYNTLGKQIMQFCEPLAGIRKLESNHINWLDLVRKIRLQGKSIFSLFIEQIRKCNFGGRNGLTMAMPEDVIKLEIAEQFSKLVVESKIKQADFDQENIKILVSWFFMNNSKEKGVSPATDLLFSLSKNVYKIFEKVTQLPNVIPQFIKVALETRKQGQMIETLFEQKKASSSNALELNKRFSQCFQSLINLLCVNDELYSYFAFDIKGLQYLLEKAGLSSVVSKQSQFGEGEAVALTIPQQQFLISQGLVASLSKQNNQSNDKSANTTEIKQEQFATNVQLVPNKNEHNIICSNVDWTAYKKGNKNKIIFLPMNGPTHHQYPLHVSLSQACEVRSIKIGFPAASFEMADKLIASPSFVLLEGGMDLKNLQSMGEMQEIDDDGYASNGVKVFVLNAQKIKNSKLRIDDAINTMACHRIKYLKIIVKRPVVSFIQGQFSPLNGKPYTNLGCNISFLSVLGDNFQKRKLTLLNSCKEISRTSALTILGTVINQANPQTVKRVSDSDQFVTNFKNKFNIIQEHMVSYPNIVPHIVYSLGSSNEKLGDWVIDKFLSQGNGDIQAKLLNQILMSSEKRIYNRLDIFLKHILNKIHQIINESDIQSNIKFGQSLFFIQSFCKTLQESYDFGITQQTTLKCSFKNIEEIITLYDKKYSSPEIKTFNRLLINLLYLRSPIKLSQDVRQRTLNLIWQNCSEAKPYFYILLGSLLLNKKNREWISQNNHEKLTKLFLDLNKSVQANSLKIINPQMFLMWILSFHESSIIIQKKMHLELYDKIKNLILPNFEIFDHLMKLIQNVVIGNQDEERLIAGRLIEDVDLLVKRKDPNLQQLYVGILRLERQINVNIKGFDVDSQNNKKESFLTSKILNKAQIKMLSQKINKKIKFSSMIQSQSGLKSQFFDKVYNAINASQFLMIIKLKLLTGKYGYFGCYSPGKAFRSEEDSYCWEDVMNYQKGSFIFQMSEGQTKFFETNEGNQQMISLCGGQDQMDQSIIFYDKSAQIVKLPFSNGSQNNIVLPNFTGAQVQSVEVYSGVLKASTMEPKILASSSKASIPFNYYRTSNVYIFPYRINIEKFMSIIGIRGVCKDKNKKIGPDQILGVIGQESDDFIVDIEIQVQQSENKQKLQQGYFPTMRIFDKFSQLGGVNKVLEVGSQSIKDWQKAQRRKSFEHYMSQLRNFVHLPSFFNHYIKHQESITFLFQVASGMPDDPNNQKNWQQQQIKSSKFIYKILADIYKYDKTLQIRDMSKYSQFCQLILQKLAQISKQTVRICKETQTTQVSQPQQTQKTGEAQKSTLNAMKQKKKKKGIGYSNDNQNSSKWSAAEWVEHRKSMNQQIQRVASIFVSFLDCEKPLTDHKLSEIIKNSCLLPLIESALRSGSLLDISKQADLFRNYLNIIKSLSANPATIDCLLDIDQKYKPPQTESIYKLLTKLHGIAEIFIDCLKSGKTSQQNETAAVIAGEIEKTFKLVDKAVKNLTKKAESITIKQINNMPTGQAYRFLLGGLRFGYVDMKKTPGKDEYAHFYASTIPKGSPPTAKILRLSQQLADLSSSLPCEHTNSIFVRCDKSRIDVIKILIMGSKDTPYSNGAFMFDLFCEDSYPNNPPKMSITTTGSGKIRFNPNLYACGKVCLSLLGTWRGQASQNWDAKISTLLQLFISTQGITMSQDLYFNEPGFDSEQGTVEGQRKNEAYANIVRIGNVRYAINEQIKNPPKGFEDVINRHFYVKQKQILEEIQKWIQQADTKQASYTGLVNDHNTSWCNQLKVKGKYKQLLLKQYNQLKTLLEKLPQPNLQQKEEQVNFETQKAKKKPKVAKQIKLGEIDVSYDPQAEKQLHYEEGVMQDRWSRYIGAMGIEAVKKQAESKVILVGLKPLGLQIAKNLVLSGLKQLCIVDEGAYGFGSEEHFYMSDVKSKKIEQCIHKVKELNPYMLVKCQKQIPNLSGYQILVSTQPFNQALELSALCRKNNIKFIYAQTCGVSGLYFSDLGKQFSVEDPHGEQPFEGLIKEISCDKEGVVKLLDGVKHPYQDGDYVVIDRVQGMKEKEQKIEEDSYAQSFYNDMVKSKKSNTINGKVFQIKVINWNSFSIGDTTNFEPYVKNGLCKNINIPKKIDFHPLQQCASDFDKHLDPLVGIYDFEKMGDNYSVFACSRAFSDFIKKNNRKPKNWQLTDAQQFENILKTILEKDKKTEQQVQSILKFGRKYALISEAELPVIGAYFGGIVSQQVVKAITNKYTPIKQFFTFHFNEMIQQIPQDLNLIKDLQIKQNQLFPNIKIIVGRQNSKKIEQMKAFVIGAGAIGCELLKNFAMVNMGAQGMITVTDPDHIETSNLTRQFLFRQKHVKKPKSATAAATLIQMNPLLKNHISARLDKVSQLTEDIYSDEFFDAQTIIANALDNVKARVYVDSRCVINSKPLFESGTLGPKGHVQVIIPHKTQNYGNQTDPTQENQIPHCTLKMFPEQTVHCIEWGRDIFGKVFTLNPKALKKVIQAKDFSVAEGQQKTTVIKMLQHKPTNFDDCVAESVRKFYKYFRNNVRQLLHTYPIDMKTKDGNLFWTLPKRPPKQIKQIDFSDPIHQKFIVSYAVLLAKIYQLPFPKDFRQKEGIQKIMSFAKQIKPQQFVPSEQQSQKIQKMTQNQEKGNTMQQQATEPLQKQQQTQHKVQLSSQSLQMDIKPQQFEKDQDSNGHIDLIYAMSNLRSRNYGLNECTWIQAKLKAGKIMAALSTTTSVVAALQTIEIVKLVIGSKSYRNSFINLAVPLIQISEPGQVPKHKIGNTQFTAWDTWQFKAESIKDLLKQIQDKYQVEGYNLSTAGGVPVYWEAMYVDKEEAKEEILNRPLNKIFQQKTTLNILMRSKNQDKKPFENLPRVVVTPVTN